MSERYLNPYLDPLPDKGPGFPQRSALNPNRGQAVAPEQPDISWARRFAYKGESTYYDPADLALVRARLTGARGDFERPPLSVVFNHDGLGAYVTEREVAAPAIAEYVTEKDIKRALTLGVYATEAEIKEPGVSLGFFSWRQNMLQGDPSKQFFRARRADRVAMILGGTPGWQLRQAVGSSQITEDVAEAMTASPEKVRAALDKAKPVTASRKAEQAVRKATRAAIRVKAVDDESYLQDPNFRQDVLFRAVQDLISQIEADKSGLENALVEENAVSNEIQRLRDPATAPAPYARSQERIISDQVEAVEDVLFDTGLPRSDAAVDAVSEKVADTWVDHQRDRLKEIEAEKKLLAKDIVETEKALQGVTVGMKIGEDFFTVDWW